jgi:fatty acid desaturase
MQSSSGTDRAKLTGREEKIMMRFLVQPVAIRGHNYTPLTPPTARKGDSSRRRRRTYLLSRAIICLVVPASFATLFWTPPNPVAYVLDVLLRTYLIFVGTAMCHEGNHGHLGSTRRANLWWARLAMLPTTVPYLSFRKTHRVHHAHTNLPDQDPDHFLKPRHALEVPVRAIALPHWWLLWLWRRGQLRGRDIGELVASYAGVFVVYGVLLAFVGPARLAWGMTPTFVLVSLLLWYPFGIKTHEGFSTGPEEARSHDYYGRLMFWFSFGLSMHRRHHLDPSLAWIELRHYVRKPPHGCRFIPARDLPIEAGTS